jgi:hypothetical protein
VQYLELTDEQTDALIRELRNIIQNDRYPLSPASQFLGKILKMLRAEPELDPTPPSRNYAPPSKGPVIGDAGSVGREAGLRRF